MNKKQLQMIAAIAGLVTVVSVFLPWVAIGGDSPAAKLIASLGKSISVAGIEGGDGKIVLVLGLVGAAIMGALFLGKKLPMSNKGGALTAAICLAICTLVCLADIIDISGPVSVGIGLWVGLLAAGVGTVAAFMAWQQMGGQVPSVPATSDDAPSA